MTDAASLSGIGRASGRLTRCHGPQSASADWGSVESA
jgi:hypothetical protein